MKSIKKSVVIMIMILALIVTFSFIGCKQDSSTETEEVTEEETMESTSDAEEAIEEVTEEAIEEVTEEAETAPLIVWQNVGAAAPYIASMLTQNQKWADVYGWNFIALDGNLDALENGKNMGEAVAMNPDLIISTPVDTTAVSSGIRDAWNKGIPVLMDTINCLPEDEEFTVGYTGPNDYIHGQNAAELMNEALNGEGNVIMLTTPPGQATTNLRQSGFEDKLEELGSKIEVIGINNTDNLKEKAITVTSDFITRFGDEIDGIYAFEDYSAIGAFIAITEAGMEDSGIKIVGIGGSSEGLAAVKDGKIYATTLQSPTIAQEQTAEIVQKILAENIVPPNQLDPYFNYIDIPKVTIDNVDKYLPGDW